MRSRRSLGWIGAAILAMGGCGGGGGEEGDAAAESPALLPFEEDFSGTIETNSIGTGFLVDQQESAWVYLNGSVEVATELSALKWAGWDGQIMLWSPAFELSPGRYRISLVAGRENTGSPNTTLEWGLVEPGVSEPLMRNFSELDMFTTSPQIGLDVDVLSTKLVRLYFTPYDADRQSYSLDSLLVILLDDIRVQRISN